MRQAAFLIITLLLVHLSFGQTPDVWVRFFDTSTERTGYKDLKGNIKIPPKFVGFTRADSFYHIIAVHEKKDSSNKSYYLLKNGRKVGQDSVFTFDFAFDCESEGKIIFYDRKKDRVGFLDESGTAVIPAVYNYASPFHNGIAIACRNAKRWCGNGGDTANCEHLGWKGGETILIDERNHVLVDSLDVDLSSICWYLKTVNDAQVDTSTHVSIRGTNNITYSFLDFEKEFTKWFRNIFLSTLNSVNGNISRLLFKEITYWSDKEGWKNIIKKDFLRLFPTALTAARFRTSKLKELSISQETGSPFMTESKLLAKYYNGCGEHNRYRFPAFDAMLTYYGKRSKPSLNIQSAFYKEYEISYQEHFLFLRTEDGYRLLEVSLKK